MALEPQPLLCYNFNMTVFASLGIVILSMLIMSSLQIVPGIFALFYHYALGKHSHKNASILGLFFILGVEVLSACLFLSSYYLVSVLFLNRLRPENSYFVWLAAGVAIALAISSFLFYYRKGSSKTFLSRKHVKNLYTHAKSVNRPSDAFTLGALSNVCEIAFTLPLYIITSIEIMEMHTEYIADNLITVLYIITPTLPLFLIYFKYHTHHNLADIIKSRKKDQPFTRFILSFSYLTIALLILIFRAI